MTPRIGVSHVLCGVDLQVVEESERFGIQELGDALERFPSVPRRFRVLTIAADHPLCCKPCGYV